MSVPTVPANLARLVKEAFAKARASGDLTFYPTQAAVLFQLRFSPALAQKPKAPKSSDPNVKAYNPFENPPPALRVTELSPSHRIVLNKFAIVPEHFILATHDFKPQTYVLEASDIDAAYACVYVNQQAYRNVGQDLFVFFNSGEHSGASQPHRHLQLLPVESMKSGLDRGWAVLADVVREQGNTLPFTIFTSPIEPSMSAEEKHRIYLDLYKRAVRVTTGNADASEAGEAQISYNLALTATTMALAPRTSESIRIDGGSVALNGTVLAGTALVKNEAEWEYLRANPTMLSDTLRGIGVPTTD
ncbi:HIT-like domain-containing protein [Xylariaceae sp. FL1272]|nr:HIT-like domain-containing protein [Xylariaceae sp. FL1272]